MRLEKKKENSRAARLSRRQELLGLSRLSPGDEAAAGRLIAAGMSQEGLDALAYKAVIDAWPGSESGLGTLRRALAAGASPRPRGATDLLKKCLMSQRWESALALIEAGAPLIACHGEDSPLTTAAYGGAPKGVLRALLDREEPAARGQSALVALMKAWSAERWEAMASLLALGADAEEAIREADRCRGYWGSGREILESFAQARAIEKECSATVGAERKGPMAL